MGGVLAGTYVCQKKKKKRADDPDDEDVETMAGMRSPLGIHAAQQKRYSQMYANGQNSPLTQFTQARNNRREGLAGAQGIHGWRGSANFRQPQLKPGVYGKHHFRGNAGGVVKHYPGPVAGDYFVRDDALGNPAYMEYARGEAGKILTIDEQIKRIAKRRAEGLDGRLPKHISVREVNSDFNRPSDLRNSPYNLEVMANAVNRTFRRETKDARVLESVQQTLEAAQTMAEEMRIKQYGKGGGHYVGVGAPAFKPTKDEYADLF
jgi:hypothetical protein